ncbi:ParB N-terminal domain-containing protein [Streptosporangiaceae bacterium NEAU-GS5]|nr:ParB N-terminal domain-containing protein [Streptosporangiaceae bacterium NEAU-GS5]
MPNVLSVASIGPSGGPRPGHRAEGAGELVAIRSLLPADSPRLAGEDHSHAYVLAMVDAELPPIVVNRRTMRVVDGMHRLRAAWLRGEDMIEARFVDMGPEDAFLLAVRANIEHGLPLSPADREAAAIRVLSSHPAWSDRSIAAATGLSAKTVAGIRRRSTEDAPRLNIRVGKDGRVRPMNAAAGRRRAAMVIAARPEASLREVAEAAGISVATARDVRRRMSRGEDPVPPRQRSRELAEAGSTAGRPSEAPRGANSTVDWPHVRVKLTKDPALRYARLGREFLRWMDAHATGADQWARLAEAVPGHWSETIAALARSCAEEWDRFAQELRRRAGAP